MNDFSFSLAANTFLRKDPDGCFLVSRLPLRLLRLNASLYRLLEHVRDGGGLPEFIDRNPVLNEAYLLRILLSLTAGGYLTLDRIAGMADYPRVSVIIPVKDQPEDLLECLQSLERLDYPRDRLEIIVVDDGSALELAGIITSPRVKVIRQAESKGQAYCRNFGADNAGGDILAFLDADCIAGEKWLRETLPFFRAEKAGAVGGYIDGYYKESFLDRYEAVASSLNMGRRPIIEGTGGSSFYVPTANMLVTREAFVGTGGFKSGMDVGEDVDFCWRMRNLGYNLLYVPYGTVAHKHRSLLFRMLKRRGDYGTSEAVLYRTHREKKKLFVVSQYTALAFLAVVLAVILPNPYPLCVLPAVFAVELLRKSVSAKKLNMALTFRHLAASVLRSYFSFFYFAFFHLARYYLVMAVGFGFLWHPLWILGGLVLFYTSITDFLVKKPRLLYPVFLFFYLLEHLAYQTGVFAGCIRNGYFGSYLLSFRRG